MTMDFGRWSKKLQGGKKMNLAETIINPYRQEYAEQTVDM